MSYMIALHWRHNEPDGVSNHQPRDCLLNCLFRFRSKKTSKLRVTGLCAENSLPVNSPHKRPVMLKNVFIWLRHHGTFHEVYSQFILLCAVVSDGSSPVYPCPSGLLQGHVYDYPSASETLKTTRTWISDVTISILASQIIDDSSVCSAVCLD